MKVTHVLRFQGQVSLWGSLVDSFSSGQQQDVEWKMIPQFGIELSKLAFNRGRKVQELTTERIPWANIRQYRIVEEVETGDGKAKR